MAKKPARYAATNENLIKHALDPAMRWLIATALDGTTMTYGDMTDRLEREALLNGVLNMDWSRRLRRAWKGRENPIQARERRTSRPDEVMPGACRLRTGLHPDRKTSRHCHGRDTKILPCASKPIRVTRPP